MALAALSAATGCTTREPDTQQESAAERAAQGTTPRAIDWKAVEQAMGRTGVMQPGDVYRFSMPRADLAVTVQGVRVRPALALGSWIAFKATSGGAIAMGDLVLRDTELAPVMSRLQDGGIEQTAIHHHLLHETPRVIYMHVHGHGDPVKIAQGLRAAVALTSTPPQAPAAPPVAGEFGIDTTQIAATLGHGGRVNGGVYQVSVPRARRSATGEWRFPLRWGSEPRSTFSRRAAERPPSPETS